MTGTGTSQDPFVIASDTELAVADDNGVFDLGLTGSGTLESPWVLSVQFSPFAELDDLPDVTVPTPTNGQVLAWDDAQQSWVAAPPTTAAAGGITTDLSLGGDGSVGDVLGVVMDPARYLQLTASGIGLTDSGINQLIRPFADTAARDAAAPAPIIGAVSMLDTAPGALDYWTGTVWEPIVSGIQLAIEPGELLALSGVYAGSLVTQHVSQLSVTTDVNGEFEILSSTLLIGYAGVLTVNVQPVGAAPGWTANVEGDTNRIIGTAYRLDDGTPYASFAITATISALLY